MLARAASKLADTQKRLEVHFAALAATRRAAALPTFAIEHGLSAEEVADLSTELRRELLFDGVLQGHWLLWVVYASELGYDYDGLEYWPYLEAKTPGWRTESGNRERLKACFLRFERAFEGFRPVGAWAEQFSIIARPIAHAILPRDLQQQLARLLWEQRYLIARFAGLPPNAVGSLLRTYSHGSSRLRNFLQNEELAGRIVLALLGNEAATADSFIADAAFQRILKDLESTRNAATWLRDARKVVQAARIKFEGRADGSSSTPQTLGGTGRSSAPLSIKPRLRLRHQPNGTWMVVLDLPSFADLASSSPQLASFLKTTRFNIPSVGNTWYPRGSLLQSHRKKLVSWPQVRQPVIKLESWSPEFNHLVQSECRISAASQWLFKIGADGDALEVFGGHARPGERYILVRPTVHDGRDGFDHFAIEKLECAGVVAVSFSLTHSAGDDQFRELVALGLSVEKTIRVWPVGVPPVQWDGESSAEWFTGDAITLALQCDGSCKEVVVRLNGEELRISEPTERVAYLGFGQLPEGQHKVNIAAEYVRLGGSQRIRTSGAQTSFTIEVRSRRKWVPGISSHSGLVVNTVPHEPSLEGILSGQAIAYIAGPAGRKVRCAVSMRSGSDEELGEIELGWLDLPVSPGMWTAMLSERNRKVIDPDLLHRASAAFLIVDGADMGQARQRLHHFVSPIRWNIQGSKAIELQVINDSANESELVVRRATFRYPTSLSVVPHRWDAWAPVDASGLYVASNGADVGAIVVCPPPAKLSSFEQLAERPALASELQSGEEVIGLLEHITLWSEARYAGPLAQQRRQLTIQAMEQQLVATMCGGDWMDAERRFKSGDLVADLERAYGDDGLTYAISISQSHREIFSDYLRDSREALLGVAIRYHVCGDEGVCEAALRLFGAPTEFLRHYRGRALATLNQMVEYRPLLWAARHAFLMVGEKARLFAQGWSHDFTR